MAVPAAVPARLYTNDPAIFKAPDPKAREGRNSISAG